MPVPEPFTTIAISASVVANLATDILKHYAESLDNTFAGRVLKHTGLIEPNFYDRIHDSMVKALKLYFDRHPQYIISGVMSFFRDPKVAKQLGDYVLNRQPIDYKKIQESLSEHLTKHPLARITIEDRKLNLDFIVPDFLKCYREVLNQQLSIPQMGILLEIVEQQDFLVEAIWESETNLKEFIAKLLETKLSPVALAEAYREGQEQLANALVEEVKDIGLLQPDEAEQVIQERLQNLPALFSEGLCKGRPLHPAPDEYFVSHGFTQEILSDWRETLTETLAHATGAKTPLKPFFAGDRMLAGFKLCAISEKICATRFSAFLLPPSQDRNVFLELGIAIGLGVPFFLIQHYEADIPPILQGLNVYTNGGLFRRMRRELAGQIEEYDFGVVRFVKPQLTQLEAKYLLAPGDLDMEDEDFKGSIEDAIKSSYPGLQVVTLGEETGSEWLLENLVTTIQSAQFAIYRVDESCSPTTFLALGISIGLNRPFLMLHHTRNQVPESLRGIGIHKFFSYVRLEQEFVTKHNSFFDRHASPVPPVVRMIKLFTDTQPSKGIPSDLYSRLRSALADCQALTTNESLRAVFVTEELAPWRKQVPQSNNIFDRVDIVISFLHRKRHHNGSYALVSLLETLSRVHDASDAHHHQLAALAQEVKALYK